MDERKKRILHAIIHDYVETIEPVGSRTIARKYNLGVSSATIRNEMADLEELGYIEQPHTSSGRVPSDKGYRYYVDFLMKKMKISTNEEKYVNAYLKSNIQHLEDLFKKTSDVLSHLTSYVSFTMGPTVTSNAIIKQIKLIPMDEARILIVVISDTGVVENRVIKMSVNNNNEETLDKISKILTYKLKDMSLKDMNKTILNDIYYELMNYRKLVNEVFYMLEETLKLSDERKMFVGGASNILSQPEFKDVEKVRNLLTLVEEQTTFKELLQEIRSENGLTILIGGENKFQGIKDCSLITATYEVEGKVMGSLGILGPTRMVYPRASTIVEYVTQYLSDNIKTYHK